MLFKEEMLFLKMEKEVNLFIKVDYLKMKISNLNMIGLMFFLWQTMDLIQMAVNFLLPLDHCINLMENT